MTYRALIGQLEIQKKQVLGSYSINIPSSQAGGYSRGMQESRAVLRKGTLRKFRVKARDIDSKWAD